jgi:hypothetical protein
MTLVPPDGALPDHPSCPFCGERDTELFNPFGSQLSVATYWCRPCRSPFEFFKWGRDEEEPAVKGDQDGRTGG